MQDCFASRDIGEACQQEVQVKLRITALCNGPPSSTAAEKSLAAPSAAPTPPDRSRTNGASAGVGAGVAAGAGAGAGSDTAGTGIVEAQNGGASTISAYQGNLPNLEGEEKQAFTAAQKFKTFAIQLADQHAAAAASYSAQASSADQSANRVANGGSPDVEVSPASAPGAVPSAPTFSPDANSGGLALSANTPPSAATAAASAGVAGMTATDNAPTSGGRNLANSPNALADGLGATPAARQPIAATGKAKPPSSISVQFDSPPAAARKAQGKSLRQLLAEKLREGGKELSGPQSDGESAVASLLGAAAAPRPGNDPVAPANTALNSAGGLPAFSMNAAETEAELRKLERGLEEKGGYLSLNSTGLFERVHEAHRRSLREGLIGPAKSGS